MNKYHKKFLESFASENVIGLFSRYRGSAKEITESWAMLEAARNVTNVCNSIVVVVGDGRSPRTAALFAYFTKAETISIDPDLNLNHWKDHCEKQRNMGFPVERISVIKDKIENVEIDCKGKQCVVVWPHSHAPMNATRLLNYKNRIDIAMPCCVDIPINWKNTPHKMYVDDNVESPHKKIYIWETSIG